MCSIKNSIKFIKYSNGNKPEIKKIINTFLVYSRDIQLDTYTSSIWLN